MQRYQAEYGIDRNLFYHLASTAHLHGAKNPLAFLPWELSFDQYIHSPVVADPLYGGQQWQRIKDAGVRRAAKALDHQALHAHRLRVAHPVTGEMLELEAALPDELAALRSPA